MLRIYNTLTRKKERFQTLRPKQVGLYVCGVTVYDACHIGHARAYLCFDVVVRYLQSQDYQVHYVRNITDVDDKIIARAAQLGITCHALTEQFRKQMHEDFNALHIAVPQAEPCATESIPQIITLIQRLIEKGVAYHAANQDVYFSVEKFADYGKLSHKTIEELASGARVEVIQDKRLPQDFVLWKAAKPHEPQWESPWGPGRPGWHIECSAMSMHALGEHFDIHGGGLDLQFPHHENEIAQSEAATGLPFAKYWMHIGMLEVNEEKMAKSKGNFLTIRDALSRHSPEVLRYFLLSSHYRSPLNYTENNLLLATKALTRLYHCLKETVVQADSEKDEVWIHKFQDAMNDDFNTPLALSVLSELSHEVNKTKSAKLATTLKYLGEVLGILQLSPDVFLQSFKHLEVESQWISAQIELRSQARLEKNWKKADEIRAQLLELGIELEDSEAKTCWRFKIS